MSPKATREQVRDDLCKLLRGVDLYRDWRIALWRQTRGPDAEFDPNEFVETGAETLAQFDAYTGPHYPQFLREVRAWYGHTASELTHLMKNGDAAVQTHVTRFLSEFETTTGCAFFAEAGLLQKTATKVLKRGHIASHDEYAILRDLLNDTDQTTLPPADIARVETLSLAYEATQ